MSKVIRKLLYYTMFLLLLSSCKVSQFLEEGEVLYTGSKFKFEQKRLIENDKELEAVFAKKIYPKPNKKFLGLFYSKIWFYKKVKPKENKEKSFKHWLKNKLGEPPVYIKDIDEELMTTLIDKTMLDYGYFGTKTNYNVESGEKKGKVVYEIDHSKRTYIDSIIYPKTNGDLDSIVLDFKDYYTKPNRPYSLKNLKKDRVNLATNIRSLGYFDFDEQDLFFIVDTSVGKHLVDLHIRIKNPKNDSLHRKYFISKVNVYPTFESKISTVNNSKFKSNLIYKSNLHIFQNYEYIGKRALGRNILIERYDLFSVADYNYTAERLNNLDIFKFVNINYNKVDKDSLEVDIQLTPGKYQGVRADVEATTSNRSFLGSSFSVSYDNRNLFRGAEKLTVKASAGSEFQFVNSKATVNILDFKFEMSLAIPKLFTPFKTRKIRSSVPPKTVFSFQENYQRWLQYYTLNSLNLSYGYDWQNKKKHHHKFNPLFFNVLSLLNTTDEFETLLSENPLLETSFNSSVILGQNYNFSLSTQRDNDDKSYIYFSGLLEAAGNLSNGIANLAKPDRSSPYEMLNVPFAQYIKVDGDIRHYWQINPHTMFATRLNAGIGFAYGNSIVLPQVKQFFVGGPNTLRAFPFRSVGPGNYSSLNSDNDVANPLEQSGDIRIMINAEYRYDLYKFIKGALFLDVGNVWLIRDDPSRPSGQFKVNQFLQQLALGTGTGIRLDFDFFAIRADLGIPIYKPYNNDGERWISQFPESGFKDWRQNNWVWNIAIGYPF